MNKNATFHYRPTTFSVCHPFLIKEHMHHVNHPILRRRRLRKHGSH